MRSSDDRRAIAAMARADLEDEVYAARRLKERTGGLEAAFLSAMSHELRTPLNAILGFTDILLQGFSGPLNGVQVRQLESIDRAAKRLMELVNDVLDLAKAQEGSLALAREEFDLEHLAGKVATEVEAEADRRGLPFHLEVAAGAQRAIGDLRRTEQVMRHLFSNAVKFTEKGEVRVEVRREETEVIVLVRDTGIGIAPEQMGGLFQPFRQLDAGHARRFEGAGLGLSLSKLFVEAMGGRIWAESTLGAGSTFGFSLPAASS